MRTNPFDGTSRFYVPIFANIEMIPRPVETTSPVAHFQIIFREIPVRPGGGTVDYNQVNLPHRPVLSLFLPFLFLRKKNRTSNTMSKILSIISLHFIVYFIDMKTESRALACRREIAVSRRYD